MPALRRSAALALVAAIVAGGCSGDATPPTTTGPFDRAARTYASSALRALDGTAYAALDAPAVADLIVGLCEGLGVGAMGVAAADTGVVADAADVTIFLEVVRVGLDQVCQDTVLIDPTALYLRTIDSAVGGAAPVDPVAAIRAAPLVCGALGASDSLDPVVVVAVAALFGPAVPAGAIDVGQARVVGAVIAASAAFVCPEHAERVADLGTAP